MREHRGKVGHTEFEQPFLVANRRAPELVWERMAEPCVYPLTDTGPTPPPTVSMVVLLPSCPETARRHQRTTRELSLVPYGVPQLLVGQLVTKRLRPVVTGGARRPRKPERANDLRRETVVHQRALSCAADAVLLPAVDRRVKMGRGQFHTAIARQSVVPADKLLSVTSGEDRQKLALPQPLPVRKATLPDSWVQTTLPVALSVSLPQVPKNLTKVRTTDAARAPPVANSLTPSAG